MNVQTYKAIKATTQLVGVVAMVFAMESGMDAGTAGLIIGAIVLGPEAIEAILLDAEADGNREE
ncbi:hypothetical protein [Natrialba sp. SSL1]|uniref:hypothetical protein n=1 Tax=Natrialba sp. SSL1 TaxID=1869245 RepID=UPI0008F8B51F|nr:hypothetical protein [Natrialba sp. SSL1]OIB56615.1 hypothetical protein BBD46_16635 [Natrialba sp. SSL1]